jgi:uncharacterized protein (TIGR02444 family)
MGQRMLELCADKLWAYSLAVYQHEEVKTACLELQDSMGLNVNIILSMMHLSAHDLMYNFDDIAALEQAISKSDKALKRHRVKRQGLKTVDNALYAQSLKDELGMEKAQQAEIVTFANTLFFHHQQLRSRLSSQLAALCIRQLNHSRQQGTLKLDPRTLSGETLKACGALVNYV